MIYKRHIYIYIDVTLLLEHWYFTPCTGYRHLQKHGSRRKLLGSDPRRVHGWRFCVLSPTGGGIPRLGVGWGWFFSELERDGDGLDLPHFFVLHWCFICVPCKFPLDFYLDTTTSPLRCFFSSHSTSKCIMYDLFLPNISYGSRILGSPKLIPLQKWGFRQGVKWSTSTRSQKWSTQWQCGCSTKPTVPGGWVWIKDYWVVATQIFVYFHPEAWGRWTHFDEHIFQRGWFNHQLDYNEPLLGIPSFC